MCVCVQTALNKSRPLSMAPETDGAGCCCLSDENNRERSRGGERDQPSVLSLRLASSWDDFVSLETEVCGKGEGIGVFFCFFLKTSGWVHIRRGAASDQTRSASNCRSPSPVKHPTFPWLSITRSLKVTPLSVLFLSLFNAVKCLFSVRRWCWSRLNPH